jgi:hypothetical protein
MSGSEYPEKRTTEEAIGGPATAGGRQSRGARFQPAQLS